MQSYRRAALLIVVLALAHGAIFTWYQRPDWTTQWTDQVGYQRLSDALARTGRFTRYPDTHPLVPEVLHTPLYPMFLAGVYRAFGQSHEAVAVVQTIVFAGICLIVMQIVRRVGGDRAAMCAGGLTAAYSPLPYFAALVLTEVFAAFLLALAMWRTIEAHQSERTGDYAIAGVALALVALTRPVFVLMPLFIAGCAWLLYVKPSAGSAARWGALLVAFSLALSPWLAYNYTYFHRVTMSPAGGVGRAMWEGSWQGTWSGRTQAALIKVAETDVTTQDLDDRVRAIAAEAHYEPALMLEYVHQWRAIRAIWDTPTDPAERAAARIQADEAYLRTAVENDRRGWAGLIGRRLSRGTALLWAGDIPIRYSDINATSPLVIRALWALQLVLFAVAAYGALVVWRRAGRGEAILLAAPVVYITLVHLPLTTEPRLALPGKPIVLALAGIGLASLVGRRRSDTPSLTSPETSGA